METVKEIRIVCDQTFAHRPPKNILVDVFRHLGTDAEGDPNNGRWTTLVRSQAAQRKAAKTRGRPGSGITLVDDEVWDRERHGMRPEGKMRSVYAIECPVCITKKDAKGYPSSPNEETLFGVLNRLRQFGITQMTLRELAARLSRMGGNP